MMIRASAALIGALLVGVVQAAQEPAAAPTIAAVRARVQAGELDRAWALIQKVPETGETLREGITIALARQDISGAVAWYERLSRREPAGDARLLGTIATVRARLLRTHEDPAVRVQACAALLPRTDEGCDKELRSWAGDGALDFTTRLAAAAALVRAGKENSRPLLQDIVQSAPETSGAAVADALGGAASGLRHTGVDPAGIERGPRCPVSSRDGAQPRDRTGGAGHPADAGGGRDRAGRAGSPPTSALRAPGTRRPCRLWTGLCR